MRSTGLLLMLASCQAASSPATTESSTPTPTVTASVAAKTPEPAPLREDLDTRVANATHDPLFGPFASLESFCAEVRQAEPSTTCMPGEHKALSSSARVLEAATYTVQQQKSSSDAYFALRTAQGWFVQRRSFPPVEARLSHHTPVAETIPLSRLRLVNGDLFLVHEHVAHSYQPGMGAAFATRTTTESRIHCELDAQPNCTEAIAVHVRRCTNASPGTEDCTDEALRP